MTYSLKLEKKQFTKKLKKNINKYYKKLQEYTSNPNDENIHDVRISIRRLETVFQILPKNIRRNKQIGQYIKNAKELFKLNAKIRDHDIICAKMELNYPDKTQELVGLLKNSRAKEIQNAINLATKISESRIPEISNYRIKKLKLKKRYSKVISKIEFNIQKNTIIVLGDEQRVNELHRLRKDFKKLRYSLELIANRRTIIEALKNLKNIQDKLGEIHDSDIMIDYLGKTEQNSKFLDIMESEILERKKKYNMFVTAFLEIKPEINNLKL